MYTCGACGQPSLQRVQTQQDKNALAVAIAGGAIGGIAGGPLAWWLAHSSASSLGQSSDEMTGWDLIPMGCSWLKEHQIGVTLAILILAVPWYVRENLRRKGGCKTQVWFMFSINIIGVVAGAYVL